MWATCCNVFHGQRADLASVARVLEGVDVGMEENIMAEAPVQNGNGYDLHELAAEAPEVFFFQVSVAQCLPQNHSSHTCDYPLLQGHV